MPRTELEIMTERITIVEEKITVVADVPQDALDGDLHGWVERQLTDGDSDLSTEVNNDSNVEETDERKGFEVTEVFDLGPRS
jgi:hypothetical protein